MSGSFDPQERERLPEGVVVLEAGAGTGKTHALEGLYLRLVAEEGLLPDEILAATYTRAATAELRQRIHALLARARSVLAEGGDASGDARLARLAATPGARERVEAALAGFDLARIETLHAFCARLLGENAFEAGGRFESEIVAEADDVLLELAEEHLLRRGEELGLWLQALQVRPEWTRTALASVLRTRLARPHLLLVTREPEPDTRAVFLLALEAWRQGGRDELAAFIRRCVVRRAAAYREEFLNASLDRLGRALEAGTPWNEPKLLAEYGETLLRTRLKDAAQPPPEIARLLDALRHALEDLAGVEVRRFLEHAVPEARRRLAVRSLRTFDGLLGEAHAVLHGERGEDVARRVRAKLRAALLDEFQDTDRTQWDIVRRLFTGGGRYLFLIGDPKQAIYGFRGASITTYIDATGTALFRGRLGTNFRSTTRMVEAVNRLFAAAGAFLDPRITFSPAAAAGKADAAWTLRDSRGDTAPPVVWLPSGGTERNLEDTAASIVGLLRGGFTFASGRAVAPGDIAVLVRGNRDAVAMQDLLRAVRVPGVLHTQMSLFETREAEDTRVLLEALRTPRSERVRAALATGWVGLDAAAIAALHDDTEGLGTWMDRVAHWRRLWRDQGVFTALRDVLASCGRRPVLLAEIGGERRLTNFLHLAEVLHAADVERDRDPDALVRWLEARQAGEDDQEETLQLRLESDASAVQVVTIHKSKGLQYPIVYCPVRQPVRRRPLKPPVVTESALVLSSALVETVEDEVRLAEVREEVRLLYVAFTRARSRLVLVVPPPPAPRSAKRKVAEDDGVTSPFDALLGGALLPAGDLPNVGRTLQAQAPDLFTVEDPVPDPGPWEPSVDAAADAFVPVVRPAPEVPFQPRLATSFSTLLAGGDVPADRREADEPAAHGVLASPAGDPLAAFPPGTRTGTAVHAVFERWRAGWDDEEARVFLGATLRTHGLDGDDARVDGLLRALRWIESRPLGPGGPAWPGSGVAVEADFLAPFRLASPGALADRIERHWPAAGAHATARLRRARAGAVDGYLRGVVDWIAWCGGVLHVVDWKTNLVGPGGPAAAVEEHGYAVQACLYAAALRRFAALRGCGEPRIETRYVFLRCLREDDPAAGVVQMDVPEPLIRSLLDLCSPA